MVDQRNFHTSLENAGLNGHRPAPQHVYQVIVDKLCVGGSRGIVKAWSSAFSAIAIQRKLRNNQERAAGVDDVEVHLACIVWKDPQTEQLVGAVIGRLRSIRVGNSDKDHQAGTYRRHYLTIDSYTRLSNSLDHQSHSPMLNRPVIPTFDTVTN